MIKVYITRLTLSGDMAERRRAASLGAHRLLATALSREGCDPASLTLCRTAEGKPYLTRADGSSAEMEISLSHSGPWAVCALSEAPVGVDIECIRQISGGVWKRFLANSPDEPCGSPYEATLRWTCCEALLKRSGRLSPLPEGAGLSTFRTIPGYLLTVCGVGETSMRFAAERELFPTAI